MHGALHFSTLAPVVTAEWINTPTIRPDMNLELGAFVVMPNHFHAILIIGDNPYNTDGNAGTGRDAMHCVSTTPPPTTTATSATDTMDTSNTSQNAFQPQSKNLSSVMRGFKSSVTTYARKNNIPFDWQPRFHDHITRTYADYDRISKYILNNPANWNNDRFNQKN